MCSWYRTCEGCSLLVLSCLFRFLPATVLLTPQSQSMPNPHFHLISLGLFLSTPSHCLCHFPPPSLLYNHCPLFCWKLQAYLKESASKAGSLKGTSVFNSCGLFDSLMCRRSHAQAASRLTVVFHSCMRSSTTDTTISQRTITPHWQNWGRTGFLSTYLTTCYIYQHLKH